MPSLLRASRRCGQRQGQLPVSPLIGSPAPSRPASAAWAAWASRRAARAGHPGPSRLGERRRRLAGAGQPALHPPPQGGGVVPGLARPASRTRAAAQSRCQRASSSNEARISPRQKSLALAGQRRRARSAAARRAAASGTGTARRSLAPVVGHQRPLQRPPQRLPGRCFLPVRQRLGRRSRAGSAAAGPCDRRRGGPAASRPPAWNIATSISRPAGRHLPHVGGHHLEAVPDVTQRAAAPAPESPATRRPAGRRAPVVSIEPDHGVQVRLLFRLQRRCSRCRWSRAGSANALPVAAAQLALALVALRTRGPPAHRARNRART